MPDYKHGTFDFKGTVSGRLSPSEPEIQEITSVENKTLHERAFMAGRGGKSNMALKMLVAKYQTQSNFVDDRIRGITPDFVIMDDIEPYEIWNGIAKPDQRDQHDWKRTKFVSGGECKPDKAKRAKLRAKRKKRGK